MLSGKFRSGGRKIPPDDRKRLRKRRRLQTFLQKKAWPRKSSLRHQHPGYGDPENCPQCAMIEMTISDNTVCAHAFDGPCFYCHGRSGKPTWKCLDCEINFCQTHVCHHVRHPVLSTHRIVLLNAQDGRHFLAAHVDQGLEKMFWRDWMLSADVIITCEEQEHMTRSCIEDKCDVTSHNNNCACARPPCECEPIELEYVLYMNDRLLERTYKTREVQKSMCLQCEVQKRHENADSMKRLRRVKRLQRHEQQVHNINHTMNELNAAFCQSLNQPVSQLPPPDVPDLTDTDDDGGPLEDDLTQIKPRPIKCEHTPNRDYERNPPKLWPNQKPIVQVLHEKDPSFVFLDSPSDGDDESSSSEDEEETETYKEAASEKKINTPVLSKYAQMLEEAQMQLRLENLIRRATSGDFINSTGYEQTSEKCSSDALTQGANHDSKSKPENTNDESKKPTQEHMDNQAQNEAATMSKSKRRRNRKKNKTSDTTSNETKDSESDDEKETSRDGVQEFPGSKETNPTSLKSQPDVKPKKKKVPTATLR